MKPWSVIVVFLACTSPAGRAQALGVPVEEPEDWEGNKQIIAAAGELRKAGKLTGIGSFVSMLHHPVPEAIVLPPAKTTVLSRPEVYQAARQSRLRVGWFFLCEDCREWHTDLAGGYPLTDDGVIATCHHVVTPREDVKEGYLIVVDTEGKVTPVTGVIASNEEMDTAVLRATGGTFHAMPLNDQVRPGDAAYCLSDPMGYNGYFSEGMVNRFYRMPEGKGTPEEDLRLNVSTDWAPGSSGSPVLDECGNVIGHVSTISAITEEPVEPAADEDETEKEGKPDKAEDKSHAGEDGQGAAAPGTQIILHEACASRSLMRMMKEAAAAAGAKPAQH